MRSDPVSPEPEPRFAFVGCFTTQQRRARGLGVEVYRTGTGIENWVLVERCEALPNPSFLVGDPTRHVLYAVHGDGDHASAFALNPEGGGRLRRLGTAATGGRNGVHQALDPSKRFLVVANYASSSVAVLPVRPDGSLQPASQVLELPGTPGPHRTEQAGSHPHHIVFAPEGRFILVPDKGLDRVFTLVLEEGRLAIAGELAMRPGAGPRHIVFHPRLPLAFLVNELDSTLATLRWDAATGALQPVHLVSTLPPDFFGASTAAAIVVSRCGRFVYASNRGQDGIARFVLDEAACRLEATEWTPSGGRDPRFMTLAPSGTQLLAANEQGDSIVAFTIAAATGALQRAGMRPALSPCTIAFL